MIEETGKLNGKLTKQESLTGTISDIKGLSGRLTNGTSSYTAYTGSYTVTPDVNAQTLNTKDKIMTNDVTVFKIPLWETTNKSGTTIYIGKDNIYGV